MTNIKILGRLEEFIKLENAELTTESNRTRALSCIEEFFCALESGSLRAAHQEAGHWVSNPLVKQGILLSFRLGVNAAKPHGPFYFADRDILALQQLSDPSIRVVPGGTAIRRGCHIGSSVTVMPPAYVNIGAFVDQGTMIDSHALVGSCAQIGKRVHISAAAQIGGVLEPISAVPVIIEDDVMIGGNCGLYEGVIIKARAVIAAGVILTSGTRVYDLVNNTILVSTPDSPLNIPSGAVVVPGSRAASSDFAQKHGLSVYTPLIIKYRDEKTDAKTALESALR